MKQLRTILALLLCLCLTLGLCGTAFATEPAPGAEPSDKADATIIVYMVGSDLEGKRSKGSDDIVEMEASGFDFERNNLIVIAGGSEKWHLDPNLPEASLSMLEIRDGEYTVIQALPSASMADPATLSMCLNYCCENYPAESYGLILWDHGSGPVVGFGKDMLYQNEANSYEDILTMKELIQALDDSPFGKDNKLSFLGFDACMMGSAEVAWLLRDYAEYLIASEELEPSSGWDYAFLGELDAGPLNGHNVGVCAVEAYQNYYLSNPSPWDATLSLSCLNLAYADQLEQDVEALFSKATVDLSDGAYSELARLRYSVAPFPAKYTNAECDLVDLGDLARIFYEEYPEETEALLNTISQMNESSWLASDRATGLTIYFPLEHQKLYLRGSVATEAVPYRDVYQELGFAPGYVAFLEDFSEQWDKGSPGFEDIQTMPVGLQVSEVEDVVNYYIQLTEEQAADTLSGGYAFMSYLGPNWEGVDGYAVTAFFLNGYVDENNRLQVPVIDYYPVLLPEEDMSEMFESGHDTSSSGRSNMVLATFYQDPETDAFHLYAFLSTTEDLTDPDCEIVQVVIPVTMAFQQVLLDPVPLEFALLLDDDGAVIPKSDFLITDYPYISFFVPIYVPTYSENGAILPALQWELQALESALTLKTYPTDSNFQLVYVPLLEEEDFRIQVFGYSTYGEPFASEPIPYVPQNWSVIGNFNGTDWDTDVPMIEIYAGMYITQEALPFQAGEEFKLRLNESWDVNLGANGDFFPYTDEGGNTSPVCYTVRNGANFVVEEAGDYYILYDSTQNVLYLIP